MRGWYAVVGFGLGSLLWIGAVSSRAYPLEGILFLSGLILIVGSAVYGIVWAVGRGEKEKRER